MSAFDPEPTLEKKTLFCKRSTTDGQIGCLPIFGTEFRMAFRQLPSHLLQIGTVTDSFGFALRQYHTVNPELTNRRD